VKGDVDMLNISLNQVEKLRAFFSPLENEVLNKDQVKMLSEKINKFSHNSLTILGYAKIPHVSEAAVDILFESKNISNADYINILESL
jgi:hypothetical protein